jgi:hypothetical protein
MTSPLVAKVDPLADDDDYNYEIYSKLWCARAIPGPEPDRGGPSY